MQRRLADKWDHSQQGDGGPAWSLASPALTEIKNSLFCKLTERCTTSCGSTKCASVHIPSNGDKRGSTPAHLFCSCVVDQRISMSVNSTTVFLWRTRRTTALFGVVLHFSCLGELVLVSHTHIGQDKMPLLLSLASRHVVCHQLAVVLRAQPSQQNPRCTQN